jgi:nucleotide-binding universal stress UspA family protein
MLKFQTILCPVDLSLASNDALAIACSLARDHGGRLIVVHCAPDDVRIGKLVPVPTAEYEAAIREGIQNLESAQPQTKAVPKDIRVLRGHPVTHILRLAKELPADVIVMATQGKTGMSRILLGSVAEEVLREASCPVIAVRSSHFAEPVPAASESRDVGPRVK